MACLYANRQLVRDQGTIPKPKYYYSDGSGRDAYIILNSGGMTVSNTPHSIGKSGRYFQFNRDERRVLKPQASMKIIHYHSDGSGRDKYVLHKSGGLMADSGQHHSWVYLNNLRSASTKGLYNETVLYEKKLDPLLVTRQKIDSLRLSTPKAKSTPFDKIVERAIKTRQSALRQSQIEVLYPPQNNRASQRRLPAVTGQQQADAWESQPKAE